MNGNWYPWSISNTGQSPKTWIAAHRRIHDRFRRAGASNVRWIWCINAESVPATDWNDPFKTYPGDNYVDAVAIDGYNFGDTLAHSRWQSFEEIFARPYARAVEKFPNKPIFIAETGCASTGGDKSKWLREMDIALRGKFSRVESVTWFEAAKEADWRMVSSQPSADAAKKCGRRRIIEEAKIKWEIRKIRTYARAVFARLKSALWAAPPLTFGLRRKILWVVFPRRREVSTAGEGHPLGQRRLQSSEHSPCVSLKMRGGIEIKLWKIALGVSLAGGLGVAPAFAQPNETPTTVVNPPALPPVQLPPALRAPRPVAPKEQIEFDLREFFAALNALKDEGIVHNGRIGAHISGGRIGFFGAQEWTRYFVAERGKVQYRLGQIEFETLENDVARVKISYALLTPNNVRRADGQPDGPEIQSKDQVETLDLKREIVPWDESQKWRIVPPSFENVTPYQTLSLAHIAYFGSQRAGTLAQLRSEISVSRLKQAGLGVLQFVQDYDGHFRFENEFWREAVKPYVARDALFLIPGTQTPYTFNDNLSDKTLNAINEPARTVLFYEGSDQKPAFRYGGKAAICFVDGHVGLVTPEDAETLIWKP